ncbi:PTS sugar transporter subunit IIA [Sebaldella sp. S0638]|uniref:PTS sugar transporter subunit IIA n=1 Tax=Sebaldella sp. S0638 TaxID=2957809 RepID=UPI0020A1CE9D|nr:PTS sugar transporter subunit IIA [Sebaldella sp. S0638]MCP1226193.1 PTS sugar transporter subunit IIA [Sebaldella sp. S0638]
MNLIEFFNEKNIELDLISESPEEIIRAGGNLLMENGSVLEGYIDEMLNSYKKLKAYMVISPGIAIPHARPDSSVIKSGISFIRLKNPVFFGHPENDPVSLVFSIAGTSGDNHIELIQMLSEILFDKNIMNGLYNVKTKEDFLKLLSEKEGK